MADEEEPPFVGGYNAPLRARGWVCQSGEARTAPRGLRQPAAAVPRRSLLRRNTSS